MSKNGNGRLDVRKMYKLFINGAFVRSESGRSDPLWDGKAFGANIARASRKDARDAVVAARAAQTKWAKTAPGTRGLVLYRLAEMMEARRAELVERVREGQDLGASDAEREVTAAIDRTVWYAGWCDKYNALLSTRNPVGGPHFNFSTAEPMGVVAILAPSRPALLGLVSVMLPAIVGANAVVVLASETDPRTAVVFAETLATSDLPAGVVNLLTGSRSEVAPVLAKHMDVNAFVVDDSDPALRETIAREAAENVKRVHAYPARSREEWFGGDAQSLDEIAALNEIKTIWHPAGV
ncbi:MAG TPA: aldehyde dehydrogenase family protein [Candidatus Baltobacteraceae bacterium]|nr:aldehyde dehydrogenase family protein [Candidatus Baltobacteraceae bacterium]